MDILHKHTSAFFGRKQQIQRSGKLLYSAGKIRRESERMGAALMAMLWLLRRLFWAWVGTGHGYRAK